jgi:anti-sigma factor ChrR (cupin superfamily)
MTSEKDVKAATMTASINGDLSVRVAVDTARMPWTPSPSGTVWRKRVHLVGPPEAGQVTSVVRYEPRSRFPAHDHPDGEEILVLDGVFSDEHGDWPAGTYLLNPEGFRHAPFSEPGCLLFVKLRQYPGRDRRHVVVDTNALDWASTARRGVAQKPLYEQAAFSDFVVLEQWRPNADLGVVAYPQGAELFVLDGEFADDEGVYGKGCWLRLPVESRHHPRTARGCTLYVKRAGLRYLTSARR